MVAAEDNEMPIISLLVKYGADVNLQDDLGEYLLSHLFGYLYFTSVNNL